MPLPYLISPSQVDAKSPVDDNLASSIKADLDYLYSIYAATPANYTFKVNGPLSSLPFGQLKMADAAHVSFDQTFAKLKLMLRRPGLTGSLSVDMRDVHKCSVPISSIAPKFVGSTQSIAPNSASSLNTQSITRADAPKNVQSIIQFKPTVNIMRIYNVSGNTWALVTDADMDADWSSGHVYISGATAAGNNGTFPIVKWASNGSLRLISYTNASGVAQSTTTGSVTLSAVKYVLSNPADSNAYVPGESLTTASCTAAVHNGTNTIYAINQGGSNIVIKSSAFAGNFSQGAPAGTVSSLRWIYALSGAPNTLYFVVGETCTVTGHTSGLNDSIAMPIVRIVGSSIWVYNPLGSAQGGAVGIVVPNYFIYTFPSVAAGSVATGDTLTMAGHATPINDGQYTVKTVTGTTIIVYNSNGSSQAGVAGAVTSNKKVLSFTADQSSIFAAGKYIEIADCGDTSYNQSADYQLGFKITEVNYGGGSNYNAVIVNQPGTTLAYPSGYIYCWTKSILNNPLTVSYNNAPLNSWVNVGTSTDFIVQNYSENSLIALYILSVPTGDPRDLVVQLS